MAEPRSPQSAQPYPHQVGGHGLLAVAPHGKVIKPSSRKELDFYQYINSHLLPDSLRWIRQVTPSYHGEADFPRLSLDSPPLPHTPPLSLTPTHPNHPPASPPHLPPLTTPHPATHPANSHPATHTPPTNSPPTNSNSPSTTPPHAKLPHAPLLWRPIDGSNQSSTSISPWAARMVTRLQNTTHPSRRPRPCIALEDINRAFVFPCVMDCKIGTRHYDDDASEAKRQRHIWKAKSTTSAKCGVRYTGMQSFKRDAHLPYAHKGAFKHHDKYLGRTLTEKDLVPWATWFFHDNHRVRTDCVRLMLDKVRSLRVQLDAQRQFFFYSSSLLLVYEGALEDVMPPRVDVRMIDFAHTVKSKGRRDDGYVLGIDYLIKILTTILDNHEQGVTALPEENSSEATAVGTTEATALDPSTVLQKATGMESADCVELAEVAKENGNGRDEGEENGVGADADGEGVAEGVARRGAAAAVVPKVVQAGGKREVADEAE